MIDILRAVCHCGHHRDTHFEKSGTCLGIGCDVGACTAYRSDRLPRVPAKPRVRHDAVWNPGTWSYDPCQCKECL